ncbi:hypothetical protein KBD08_03775 [Candidatus Babeliales bacterium]|nr:hypothetical protein [Candidatus Babeliales bacterium]
MKFSHMLKVFLITMLPMVVQAACSKPCKKDCYSSHNTMIFRAFSSSSLRQLIQEPNIIYEHDKDHYMYLCATSEYSQNFNRCKPCNNVATYALWSGTNELTFGRNDGRADVDAYYFGFGNIPVNEDGIGGKITLNPQIQMAGTDIMLYYAHKKNDSSFYFKLFAPLGAISVNPNLKETMAIQSNEDVMTDGISTTPPNNTYQYANLNYPTPERRYQTLVEAWTGGLPGGAQDNSSVSLNGNIDRPIRLRKGRIAPARVTDIKIGDMAACFGYNWLLNRGSFAVGLKATCPTGSVPTGDFMLEPIFGRGGVWGIGAEVFGYAKAWQNEEQSKTLLISWQGEVLHLMPGRKPAYRSFDLKANGPGSKYMLAQYYRGVYTNSGAPNYIYSQPIQPQNLTPVIDLTTLPVLSTFSAEGSFATMINYIQNDWTFKLGGEVWGRSFEKISLDIPSTVILRFQNLNSYAVVGRQVGAYIVNGQTSTLYANLCEPLATINQSENTASLSGTTGAFTVPTVIPDGVKDGSLAQNRIPEKITEALDVEGASAPSVISGKLTGAMAYTWSEHYYPPTLTIFGGIEFANNNSVIKQLWHAGVSGSIQF